MGTTYSFTLTRPQRVASESAGPHIDSILAAINAEVNTYDPSSDISRFNSGESIRVGPHLLANLRLADQVYTLSEGLFDPSVSPLIDYYGFGSKPRDTTAIQQTEIDSLLFITGWDRLPNISELVLGDTLSPPVDGYQLDLSAVAKGYAVDVIANSLLRSYVPAGLFAEIGGETVVQGQSPRGEAWRMGVNTPKVGASTSDVELILALTDLAVATSGNYRNTRSRGGKRYVHTIDPRDGSAGESLLLSATVVDTSCARADALATAAMVAGQDAPAVLAKAEVAACLIFASPGDEFEVVYLGNFERLISLTEKEN